MHRFLPGLALALLLHAAPAFSQAQMSMLSLGKQILQNVAFGSVKNELIGSLAGMGCRGSTIAGLAAGASAGGAKGASGMDPAAMQRAMEMAQKQLGAQGI